jgi:dTDP-4-dehydrorhamnose 3,5-epimerase-like enzyme
MVSEKYVDHRGEFQELLRQSETAYKFNIQQVSACTINPGQVRGGHYHKRGIEAFVVLEGAMTLTQQHVRRGWKHKVVMTPESNALQFNEPWVWHEVSSVDGCKFLILQTWEYDPENPDTFRYEDEG